MLKVYAEGSLTSNDFIINAPIHDGIVTGTAGNDLIDASYVDTDGDKVGAGNDSIIGLTGNDTIYGLAGNDTIDAGEGKDVLVGGAGADVLSGGAGDDMVDYATSNVGVVINLATGHGSVGDAEGDTYISIEGAFGSYGNDTMIAGTADTYLHGGLGGDDSIIGNIGNDFLAGRVGNDTIMGGVGNDSIYGDSDTASGRFTSGTDADLLVGGSGNDYIDGGWGNDTLYGDDPVPTPIAVSTITGPNLIVNGSFESFSGGRSADIGYRADNVTGWTKLAGGGWGNWELLKGGYAGISIADGRYALDMESSGNSQNMDIQQNVHGVVAGQDYTLSFVVSAEAARYGNAVDVYWGGKSIGHVATDVVGNQTVTFTVTGGDGNGSNALRLQGQGPIDGVGLAIDNVKLMAVNTSQPVAGGNDTLYGGNGGDIMTGGGGRDVFQFNAADTFNSLVTDFTHGTDKIALIGVNYSQLTIANENGTAAIYFNVNGHAEAIHLEHVNASSLNAGDFIFS